MKCGSDGCDRPAVARWVVVVQDGRVTPTAVQGTYLLCLGHDEWYQDMDGYTTFRLGLLRDEVCLHTPGQRHDSGEEAAHEPGQ